MAVTSGYFNSVNGDRKYNADQMSEYFEGIINEGVCQHIDGGLAVTAGTGLSVSVAAGKAFIGQKWIRNDAALTLTIGAASTSYARIDAVVVRRNNSTRTCEIAVKSGTPAASPAAPTMTRNSTTYEMALAYVNVAANATSVTVTDKRADTTVCGWATVAESVPGEIDAQLNAMKTGFDGVVYSSPAAMVTGEDQKLQNQLAVEFSPAATYKMKQYVWHQGELYRCIVDVSTPGSWASHTGYFEKVNVGEQLTYFRNVNSQMIAYSSGTLYSLTQWKHGMLQNGIIKSESSYPARICSVDILTFDKEIILTAANGFTFALHFIVNGAYSSDTGWVTNYTVPANGTFRIQIRRSPEGSSTADFIEYAMAVTINTPTNTRLNDIEYRADRLENDANTDRYAIMNGSLIFLYESASWVHGTLSDGQIKYASDYPSRINSTDMISFPYSITIAPLVGYKCFLALYNNGVYESTTNWIVPGETYTLSANQQFRMTIARYVEDRSEVVSISDLIYGITYLSYFQTIQDKLTLQTFEKNLNIDVATHRGYTLNMPENTMTAFKKARQKGYSRIETDVRFTSDNVAVLLHDSTINRTGRNEDGTTISSTIDISSITYAQALSYDFGIWKGEQYAGLKIPTLTEFLAFCRGVGIAPLIELKAGTQAQIEGVVDSVNDYGLIDHTLFISDNTTYLTYVKNYRSDASLDYIVTDIDANVISDAETLITDDNDVAISCQYGNLTAEKVNLVKAAKIKLHTWVVNLTDAILGLDPYVSCITTDYADVYNILYDHYMNA